MMYSGGVLNARKNGTRQLTTPPVATAAIQAESLDKNPRPLGDMTKTDG